MTQATDLRRRVALPLEADRSFWRDVAKRTGVVRVWRDGDRERVCLEFWIDGKRRRIFSDVNRWQERVPLTVEKAHELLGEIRCEIVSKRSIEEAIAPFLASDSPENLIGARWAKYLEQQEARARDGRVTRRHLAELRGLERRGYFTELFSHSVFELDYGRLEDWMAWLAREKPALSPKTRKHALSAIMALAHWLKRRKVLRELPEAPELEVPQHSPVLLDDDARERILVEIPLAARGIFLALVRMGLRIGEARGLDARALRDGVLTIDQAVKDQRADGEIGDAKTRQVRRLPCDPDLASWIDVHVAKRARLEGGPMFRNPGARAGKSGRWAPSSLKRVWTAACWAAHGQAFPLNESARHSFATGALGRGEPIERVRKFLGHSNIGTTEIYAKLADTAIVSVLRPRAKETVHD